MRCWYLARTASCFLPTGRSRISITRRAGSMPVPSANRTESRLGATTREGCSSWRTDASEPIRAVMKPEAADECTTNGSLSDLDRDFKVLAADAKAAAAHWRRANRIKSDSDADIGFGGANAVGRVESDPAN